MLGGLPSPSRFFAAIALVHSCSLISVPAVLPLLDCAGKEPGKAVEISLIYTFSASMAAAAGVSWSPDPATFRQIHEFIQLASSGRKEVQAQSRAVRFVVQLCSSQAAAEMS